MSIIFKLLDYNGNKVFRQTTLEQKDWFMKDKQSTGIRKSEQEITHFHDSIWNTGAPNTLPVERSSSVKNIEKQSITPQKEMDREYDTTIQSTLTTAMKLQSTWTKVSKEIVASETQETFMVSAIVDSDVVLHTADKENNKTEKARITEPPDDENEKVLEDDQSDGKKRIPKSGKSSFQVDVLLKL